VKEKLSSDILTADKVRSALKSVESESRERRAEASETLISIKKRISTLERQKDRVFDELTLGDAPREFLRRKLQELENHGKIPERAKDEAKKVLPRIRIFAFLTPKSMKS